MFNLCIFSQRKIIMDSLDDINNEEKEHILPSSKLVVDLSWSGVHYVKSGLQVLWETLFELNLKKSQILKVL